LSGQALVKSADANDQGYFSRRISVKTAPESEARLALLVDAIASNKPGPER
jgi:hypothetical protein